MCCTEFRPCYACCASSLLPRIQPQGTTCLRAQVVLHERILLQAARLLSCVRHTGPISSTQHGNNEWIYKPSSTTSFPVERIVRTTIKPTHGNIISCVLMEPRERVKDEHYLPALYRLVTCLSRKLFTRPASYQSPHLLQLL